MHKRQTVKVSATKISVKIFFSPTETGISMFLVYDSCSNAGGLSFTSSTWIMSVVMDDSGSILESFAIISRVYCDTVSLSNWALVETTPVSG